MKKFLLFIYTIIIIIGVYAVVSWVLSLFPFIDIKLAILLMSILLIITTFILLLPISCFVNKWNSKKIDKCFFIAAINQVIIWETPIIASYAIVGTISYLLLVVTKKLANKLILANALASEYKIAFICVFMLLCYIIVIFIWAITTQKKKK